MRDGLCPICRQETEPILLLRFTEKLALPTEVDLRYCWDDNFLFAASGRQSDYNEYYGQVASDSCHAEVSGSRTGSPISKLQNGHLVQALGDFFDRPRAVLDFGCGSGNQLLDLAASFPGSTFVGFDPGPAARVVAENAVQLGLHNVTVADFAGVRANGSYDLVIASHVIEHLIDFELLALLGSICADGGYLYVEVPDALRYDDARRLEFLYYFDRLHVNHFTPQSLARLTERFGFGYITDFTYAFPYRDDGMYPALGMLLRAGAASVNVSSPALGPVALRYIVHEQERARSIATLLESFEGVLVWGVGDNFCRSVDNNGPLSGARKMTVIDRRPRVVRFGNRTFEAREPREAILNSPWPVVVTVSEWKREIRRAISAIDPDRHVVFI